MNISGYLGGLQAAVIVRGDAVLTVDLNKATFEELDHQARTAVILLPLPHVESARVDHEHTRIFSIYSTGLWAVVPGDDGRAEIINRALLLAQRAIETAAEEAEVMEQARSRAEQLICTFFTDLNWSVTVRWK